ncbi:MAG: hypothetical protein PHX13_01725 [Thiovulaceae bacterium]|nr:hypothetical protein [Sulfurimonadaceae bacterium]
MNPRILQLLALVFIALVLLQSVLGGVLFWHSIGITPHAIFSHYEHKSLHGLLEVVSPHALFIAVALMATLHFLSFIPTINENTKRVTTHLLFGLFILDQGSVFFIASGFELFAIIKLGSFILFELLLGWVWIIIFEKTLRELK